MVSKQEKAKKQWKSLSVEVEITQGVTVSYEETLFTVKGPKGEVYKKLKFPNVFIKVENNKVVIGTDRLTQREKKIIFTYKAHITNLIKGVVEGYEYKLVVLFAKFPMTVSLNGDVLLVKNLLGEKVPRKIKVDSDVKVVIKGKDITVTGIDKEKTGQVAASIEQMCRVTNLDRRVVQDGIFITHKPHKAYV